MDYPVVPNGNNNNNNSNTNNNCTSNTAVTGLNSIYKGKSVNQRLLELYQEERTRQPEDQPICYATHLLPKLVKRDRLNCLVLNLYPANEGYSLMLKGRNGIESETIKLPYEESELLGYIDASELPPILVDILEKAQVNVFYSGCVIVEVRDYRRTMNGCYDSEYIMLKPTMQSLLCDINSIINDGHRWTQEDVFQLESQLLLATQEPLCLDPNPSVFFATNHQQYESKLFNDPTLKRSVKKYTQAAMNRKRKFAQAPAPKELRLLDFIKKRSKKSNSSTTMKPIPDPRNYKPLQLSPPQSLDVEKYVQAFEKPSDKKGTDNNLTMVEEHVLEADIGGVQTVIACITFLQRPSDEFYFGEQMEGNGHGEKCRFPLGTREDVDKYFKQFKKMFMKDKVKTINSIKISTSQPGRPPQISYLHPTSCSSPMTTVPMAVSQELSNSVMGGRKTCAQHLSVSVGSGNNSQQNTVSPNTTAISPSIGPGAITSSQQSAATSQPQSHSSQSQKMRQHILSNSTPSPASSNNSQQSGTTSLSSSTGQQQITGQNSQKIPTPTPTPPPTPTPTPPLNTIRRSSAAGESVAAAMQVQTQLQQQQQQASANTTTFLTSGDGCSTSAAAVGQAAAAAAAHAAAASLTPGINIANLASLPSNLNIQNLTAGMNIANLQGLQNMQVSLTGGIVPITMINNNPGLLQNQSASTLSQPALVTMVTSLPQTTSTPTTVNSNPVTSQVAMTTGMITNSGSVLLPSIGLTQLMKGTAPNLRAPPMSVMQLQNQQQFQLLNLSQQRGSLSTTLQAAQPQTTAITAPTQNSNRSSATTISVNSSGLLTSNTNLTGQPITGFTPVSIQTAKSGQSQASSGAVVAGQTGAAISQQAANQQLQFHQLQYKHPQSTASSQQSSSGSSKSKSKKRATPTPPKS